MAQLLSSAWKIIPKFQSLSISATIDFYVKTLGFIIGGLHPSDDVSEATFCSIFIGKKAEANIYFSKCESDQFHPREAMIALGTKQLDEFYEELKGKDVEIVEPIEDQEWGYRQFAIRDNDGNVITFFKFLEGGNPGNEADIVD